VEYRKNVRDGVADMATPVIMPRQGQTVESCIIGEWHKKRGDRVKTGDILFTYETDKAVFEEEAKVEGTILEIFFEEGEDVPVLTNVCVIGEEGEDCSEFNPKLQEEDLTSRQGDIHTQESASGDNGKLENMRSHPGVNIADIKKGYEISVPTEEDAKRLKISPRAKNLASRTGVDYRHADPTGPYGRIIERDITALQETGPRVTLAAQAEYKDLPVGSVSTGTGVGGRITTRDLEVASLPGVSIEGEEYEDRKPSTIRRVIAESMYRSLTTTAQLTLNTSFDATEILNYRQKIKESQEKLGLENITINDMILYAVSRILLKYRELNAHLLGDTIRLFTHVNMGVAVDTERGLMVPTVFHADIKPLNELSGEVVRLSDMCRKGTVNPDYLQGGTFTVTNLGTLGIESFTPVLNPPQTGILGVCAITRKEKERDGENIYYPALGLSLTFDHRAIDGAPAARFLRDLVTALENFPILLAE
jgi:pyruvate dehydrogenase E2 component (dihydrolipoamide acetyltransferase)